MSDETELFPKKNVLIPRGHLENRHHQIIDDLARRINCHGGTADYLTAIGGMLMGFYGGNWERWGCRPLDAEEAQRLVDCGQVCAEELIADVGDPRAAFYSLGLALILLVEETKAQQTRSEGTNS